MVNNLILGDCVEVMKGMDRHSIDCIVTDPPYGIAFMGKDWDKALPRQEAFKQMHRILKPGGIAFVMSSPRQDVLWRMLRLLENSGFELKQSFVSWIYKTGFPKAYDVSKGIDKKRRDNVRPVCRWLRKQIDKSKITLKEIALHFDFHVRMVHHWAAKDSDSQPSIPTWKQWIELKKLLGFNNEMDNEVKRFNNLKGTYSEAFHKREIKGKGKAGFLEDNKVFEFNNKGYGNYNLTDPHLKEAKKWEGWKSITGLKPALECILMVNKPLSEPTIVDNVLKHGTGAINVDGCRIPFKNEKDIGNPDRGKGYPLLDPNKGWNQNKVINNITIGEKGRFPANLLVSDKAIDSGKITKSGDLLPHHNLSKDKEGYQTRNVYGKLKRQKENYVSDIGDQSRYFDLDAWWNRQCIILDVPKPSKSERERGLDNFNIKEVPHGNYVGRDLTNPKNKIGGLQDGRSRNIHPTVKPIKLMAYLIQLGCPVDGILLDPFVGSGTTCIAAKMLNRKWIGIEVNREYINIASARLDNCPIVEFKASKQNTVKSSKEEKKEDWKNMFEVDK